jgi:hypothetical protein
MTRILLMLKALIAFLLPGSFLGTLTDADYKLELSRNQQLQAAGYAHQEDHRKKARVNVLKRLQLLRGRVLKALLFIGSAVFIAIAFEWLLPPSRPTVLAPLFAIASLYLFAWATIGRLGWAGQSFGGDSVVERLDQVLFWVSYWIGTFCGVLAIISVPR